MKILSPLCANGPLPSGQATPSILEVWLVRLLHCYCVKEALYFCALPRLACFPASSRSNVAVTAGFTSLRMFSDSCVERSSKRGVVTCNIINCVFLSLRFFWLRVIEKLAILNQKNLAIETRPTVYYYNDC